MRTSREKCLIHKKTEKRHIDHAVHSGLQWTCLIRPDADLTYYVGTLSVVAAVFLIQWLLVFVA